MACHFGQWNSPSRRTLFPFILQVGILPGQGRETGGRDSPLVFILWDDPKLIFGSWRTTIVVAWPNRKKACRGMSSSTIQLITGRFAEKGLRRIAAELQTALGVPVEVAVLPINVIALAPTGWIGRHHQPGSHVDRVILPGLCPGSEQELGQLWTKKVDRGPEDCNDLFDFFRTGSKPPSLDGYDIEILAEINFAPRLSPDQLVSQARRWIAEGADRIDLGAEPGQRWNGVADAVKMLVDQGIKVSIDSFDSWEVEQATRAGADLVLSVNGTNRHQAADWGVEVVAIPDRAGEIETLRETADYLAQRRIPHRLDPILEPIGHDFGASLLRYQEVRQNYPETPMLMGIGNVTELTEVDSAGVNYLLLALCQEWRIQSVLTTEVAGWCRGCVREIDRIRKVLRHALKERVVPKRLDPSLVMLRGPRKKGGQAFSLEEFAACLKDRNIRIFAENQEIHAMNGDFHFHGADPFELFDRMMETSPVDPSHAFYLGYEMAKAVTALTLEKPYRQDAALEWGFLTRPEKSHLERRREKEVP